MTKHKGYSRILMDIDNTISFTTDRDYANAVPNMPVIEKMRELADQGVNFVLFTARGMVTFDDNPDAAEKCHRPQLEEWMKKYDVPYSDIVFGKPFALAIVDDTAIRPNEFLGLTLDKTTNSNCN
jgi:capsule biosynthesis phosphatase